MPSQGDVLIATTQQKNDLRQKAIDMDRIENKKLLIWDKETMLERFQGDELLAKEILAGFSEDLPSRLEGLKRGLNAKDMATAALYAHSVRGAAANMGADILQHLAKEMELACNNNDVDNLNINIKFLEEAVEDFLKEISMHEN
jgi:HPt (histidine-containing phosphotransfer) domain-containing protein